MGDRQPFTCRCPDSVTKTMNASADSATVARPESMGDSEHFRRVLAQFATGIVAVTSGTVHEPVGMLVNSFTSVSLRPPLVALCVDRLSTTWPLIARSGRFAVTVLAEQHHDVCVRFRQSRGDRFGCRVWEETEAGHPTLSDALAWIDCRVHASYRAGDHDIVVASPTMARMIPGGSPILFHDGQFVERGPRLTFGKREG